MESHLFNIIKFEKFSFTTVDSNSANNKKLFSIIITYFDDSSGK